MTYWKKSFDRGNSEDKRADQQSAIFKFGNND